MHDNFTSKYIVMSFFLITTYIAHQMCSQSHIKATHYYCIKHLSIVYNCKICKRHSQTTRYTYTCATCHSTFCLLHYATHLHILTHIKCTAQSITINKAHTSHIHRSTICHHLASATIALHKECDISENTFAYYVLPYFKCSEILSLSWRCH